MNQLKVNLQQSIVVLFEKGWSKRRIARELGVDRATVRKYLAAAGAKSPTPQTGLMAPCSVCDRWGEQIQTAWQAGLSVQRIYQDLVREHQFTGSYHAVRRYVLRRQGAVNLPFTANRGLGRSVKSKLSFM